MLKEKMKMFVGGKVRKSGSPEVGKVRKKLQLVLRQKNLVIEKKEVALIKFGN